jgi:hypothetical protein
MNNLDNVEIKPGDLVTSKYGVIRIWVNVQSSLDGFFDMFKDECGLVLQNVIDSSLDKEYSLVFLSSCNNFGWVRSDYLKKLM